MRKRGLCCSPVSVLRPSVTFMCCIETAEDIVKLLPRPGSLIILVFLTLSADTQFQRKPFIGGVKYTGVGEKLLLSTEIAVYLENGTRSSHSTLIGSHRCRIDSCRSDDLE